MSKKLANKKLRGYYEFCPVIYPRLLWVSVGQRPGDISGMFVGRDGKDLDIGQTGGDGSVDFCGLAVLEVERRSDGRRGELVVFKRSKDMTMSVCCHEASHVCDAIEEAIGMEHGGEASAYLLGWIASCINRARLGDGPFVEMK